MLKLGLNAYGILIVILDNTLFFWKYPEDEQKRKAPIESESIPLHDCISETVTLAPRDICARMNTFMLENRRPCQSGDREALNMHVVIHFIVYFLLAHPLSGSTAYYAAKFRNPYALAYTLCLLDECQKKFAIRRNTLIEVVQKCAIYDMAQMNVRLRMSLHS